LEDIISPEKDELANHIESLAGECNLEIKDAQFLVKDFVSKPSCLRSFAKKNKCLYFSCTINDNHIFIPLGVAVLARVIADRLLPPQPERQRKKRFNKNRFK
jgi:hypothetical protein